MKLGYKILNILLRLKAYFILELLIELKYKNKKKLKASVYYNKELNLWHYTVNNFNFFTDTPGWHIDKHLYENIVKEITCFDYKPSQGDVIIDVGAGLGEESLIMSKYIGGSGKIYAFEAHPRVARALEISVRENNCENIEVINMAVMDVPGKIFISDNETTYLGNTVQQGVSASIQIDSIVLDDFIEEKNLQIINLLKMNIEGAEKFALKGLEKNIDKIKNVAISCHDFRAKNGDGEFYRTKEFVVHFLTSKNFEIISQNTGVAYIDDWIYGTRKKV